MNHHDYHERNQASDATSPNGNIYYGAPKRFAPIRILHMYEDMASNENRKEQLDQPVRTEFELGNFLRTPEAAKWIEHRLQQLGQLMGDVIRQADYVHQVTPQLEAMAAQMEFLHMMHAESQWTAPVPRVVVNKTDSAVVQKYSENAELNEALTKALDVNEVEALPADSSMIEPLTP